MPDSTDHEAGIAIATAEPAPQNSESEAKSATPSLPVIEDGIVPWLRVLGAFLVFFNIW